MSPEKKVTRQTSWLGTTGQWFPGSAVPTQKPSAPRDAAAAGRAAGEERTLLVLKPRSLKLGRRALCSAQRGVTGLAGRAWPRTHETL